MPWLFPVPAVFRLPLPGTLSYALLGWHAPLLPAWSLGYVYLPSFVGVVLLSVLTAPLGAKLAHQLPTQTLKQCFSLLLFGVAAKMLWQQPLPFDHFVERILQPLFIQLLVIYLKVRDAFSIL